MKIGIFGGTFNPPHNTHVNIVKQAVKQLCLDEIFVLPCGDPPHKPCYVDKQTRFRLSELAFSDIATVCDFEINASGKSYTVNTLKHFKELYPNDELYLIIGGDSYNNFHTWYKPDEILSLATLVVAERGSEVPANAQQPNSDKLPNAVFLDVEPNGVSSSEIRLRYQFGLDNSEFVPKAVNDCVLQNGLYAEYRDMANKVKGYLKPERFLHTFYVVKRGLEYAAADEYDKVFTACLLHDVAKYIPEERYANYGYLKDERTPEPVVHSYLGEKVAKKDFGITDKEILDSVRYHTTARPNMTRLDKIVYVADKTEETRSYPLEHLLSGTLDEIFIKCLIEANEYKTYRHGTDCDDPLTEQALKFYFNKK